MDNEIVVSARWGFPHPTRGTCIVGCRSYGHCHCGCGGRPKRSEVTYVTGSRYRGRPYVFLSGHHLRVVHPRAGTWSKNGVPIERIRPLILWLRERHGSMRAVAELLAMPESTLRGHVYNTKRKRVPPATAGADRGAGVGAPSAGQPVGQLGGGTGPPRSARVVSRLTTQTCQPPDDLARGTPGASYITLASWK